MKNIVASIGFGLLAACALPQTTVKSGSSQPGLLVKGAPDGAMLIVDGLDLGAAKQFNGRPKVLAILEGAHKVSVRLGSELLYDEKIFLDAGETKSVEIPARGSK